MFQDAMDQFETENYVDELVKEKNRYKQALETVRDYVYKELTIDNTHVDEILSDIYEVTGHALADTND